MEFLSYTQDAFGRRMLVGVNFDGWLWVPVVAAAVVIVGHVALSLARRRGGGARGDGH